MLAAAYKKLIEDSRYPFVVLPDGNIIDNIYSYAVGQGKTFNIIPGSFNPLHDSHRWLFANASKTTIVNYPTFYEISILRMGKPELSLENLKENLKQFAGYAPVIVTNAPSFVQKIGCLPEIEIIFHVGFDTAYRIIKDYGVTGVQGLRNIFYVYQRHNGQENWDLNKWEEVGEIRPKNMIHAQYQPSIELTKISSTQIRAKYEK